MSEYPNLNPEGLDPTVAAQSKIYVNPEIDARFARGDTLSPAEETLMRRRDEDELNKLEELGGPLEVPAWAYNEDDYGQFSQMAEWLYEPKDASTSWSEAEGLKKLVEPDEPDEPDQGNADPNALPDGLTVDDIETYVAFYDFGAALMRAVEEHEAYGRLLPPFSEPTAPIDPDDPDNWLK